MYRQNAFIGRNGNLRAQTNAYIAGGEKPVGWDIFDRGLCLPSDNKMTEEQQDTQRKVRDHHGETQESTSYLSRQREEA